MVMNGYVHEALPTEEDIIERDFRTCECALTYVVRKRHGALGEALEIRMCCLAQKVEEIAGLPKGTFFSVIEFRPSWDWDCDSVSFTEERAPDGTAIQYRHTLGAPPMWLLKRLLKKGRPVHNMDKHPMPPRKHRVARKERI